MEARLEVVIVHHRTPDLLLASLERLALHAPRHGVTVVDTAPDPGLPRRLEGIHPRWDWLAAPNHSYAHAVNLGLKATTAPLVATMNADVLVGPDTLAALAGAFADPGVALAGPVARTPAGRRQDQGLPYRLHLARLRWRGRAPAQRDAAWVAVPWLSGCLVVVRREALGRVGGMDGSLRFYNEDLEWGRRCRAAGLRCALVDTEVIHVGGASTPPQGRFLVEGLRGGYAVTRRDAPPAIRFAHRWGVAAVAWTRTRLERDPVRRATWREVLRRFALHDLDDSPFGPTLDDAAPAAVTRGDATGGDPTAVADR